MRTLFLTTAAFAALMIGAPIGNAHADAMDDAMASYRQDQASGVCYHACSPCDYAPGSGAATEYDAHHKVKLSKKCHWR
jgi:hypothetical protein